MDAPLRDPHGKLLAVLDETCRPPSTFLVENPLTQHVVPPNQLLLPAVEAVAYHT